MKLQVTLFIASCFLHYVQIGSLGVSAEVSQLEEAVLEEVALEAPQLESNAKDPAVENPKADESDLSEDQAAEEQSNAEGRYSGLTNHDSMNDWHRYQGSMINGPGSHGSMNDWHRYQGSMINGHDSHGSMNDWHRYQGSMINGPGSHGSMNDWHRYQGSMINGPGSHGLRTLSRFGVTKTEENVPDPTGRRRNEYAHLADALADVGNHEYCGPYLKSYSDSQCKVLHNAYGISQSDCEAYCTATPKCTAFNWSGFAGFGCVMRDCGSGTPPAPTWRHKSFVSFTKKKLRNTPSCKSPGQCAVHDKKCHEHLIKFHSH